MGWPRGRGVGYFYGPLAQRESHRISKKLRDPHHVPLAKVTVFSMLREGVVRKQKSTTSPVLLTTQGVTLVSLVYLVVSFCNVAFSNLAFFAVGLVGRSAHHLLIGLRIGMVFGS